MNTYEYKKNTKTEILNTLYHNVIHMKKIISIRLNEEELKTLTEIAEKEQISRSALINRALSQFINQYGKSKLELSQIEIRLSKMERGYNSLINRMNIIANQLDYLLKRIKHGRI